MGLFDSNKKQTEPDRIFATYAPLYWAKGLPAIPLMYQEKKPALPKEESWSQFQAIMPSEEQQLRWLDTYAYGNIGLPLGPQSRIVIIDIDTVDPTLFQVIKNCLPPSPWVRVGRKGEALAYRYNNQKAAKIKNEAQEAIVEILSAGNQVVLPPSIHPDTKAPYVSNSNLYEVCDNLPTLPENIEEILRKALINAGVKLSHSGWSKITEYVSLGARDMNLTEKAGLFAYAILRGERTFLECVQMLQAYNDQFVAKVAGDEVDINKHVLNIVRFLRRDVYDKKKTLPVGWDEGLTAEQKKQLGLDFTEDQEMWTYEQIMGFLKDEFEKDQAQGGAIAMAAIEKAVVKLAFSTNLSRLDIDRIIDYIVKGGHCNIKAPSIKGYIKDITSKDAMLGVNHTEIAMATIKDITNIHPVRIHLESFWRWMGSHWEEYEEYNIRQLIAINYGHMDAARRSSDIKGILAIIKDHLPHDLTELKLNNRGINFANGFLIQDGADKTKFNLLEHNPEFGMTYTLPFRYHDGMPDLEPLDFLNRYAPRFADFLTTAWSEDYDFLDKVKALQEVVGVILFGLGSMYQRAILFQGIAKSGKSQMLSILSSLVPPEARSAVSPHDWSDTFLPAQMANKILNVAGELSEKKRIDGQKFKEILDGSMITARHIYGAPFEFSVIATHIFAGNHLPRTDDTSEGFTRRWMVFQFNRSVPEEKRVVGLADLIIAEEREYIAAWGVKAMTRLMGSSDFSLPPSHIKVMNTVANLNNSVRQFLTEGKIVHVIKIDKTQPVDAITKFTRPEIDETSLYNLYWGWMLQMQMGKVPVIGDFRQRMQELAPALGFEMDIRSEGLGAVVYYKGIKR